MSARTVGQGTWIILTLLCLGLCACSPIPPGLEKVKVGMSQEEVLKLTGKPARKVVVPDRNEELWVYGIIPGRALDPTCVFDATTKRVKEVYIDEGKMIR